MKCDRSVDEGRKKDQSVSTEGKRETKEVYAVSHGLPRDRAFNLKAQAVIATMLWRNWLNQNSVRKPHNLQYGKND